MKQTEAWNRIKYLNITNIEEYQHCTNPAHARLVNILKYSINWLHFYQFKRHLLRLSKQNNNNEDQWLLNEIKLLQDLNKSLKLEIKQAMMKQKYQIHLVRCVQFSWLERLIVVQKVVGSNPSMHPTLEVWQSGRLHRS